MAKDFATADESLAQGLPDFDAPIMGGMAAARGVPVETNMPSFDMPISSAPA